MNDHTDERMDELLRRHFSKELDGQVGAAAERFKRHIGSAPISSAPIMSAPITSADAAGANGAAPLRIDASSRSNGDARRDNNNGPRFGSLWAIGIVGGALAAAVTLVSMRHTIMPTGSKATQSPLANNHSPRNRGGDVVPDGVPINVQQASMDVAWKTVDQGLVPLEDGTPARRLLQQRTDTMKWYDPKRKAQIEYTVPRQQTVYVGYNAH